MSDAYIEFIEEKVHKEDREDLTEQYEETVSMLSELSATGSYPLPIRHVAIYSGPLPDVLVATLIADTAGGPLDGDVYAFDIAIYTPLADAIESSEDHDAEDLDEQMEMLDREIRMNVRSTKMQIWRDVVNLSGDSE